MKGFGKKLRDRGKQLGLSQAEVAKRIGISQRRYSHYVNDLREPNLELLKKICRILELDPSIALGARDSLDHDKMVKMPPKVNEMLTSRNQKMIIMPEYDAKIGAGGGTNIEDVHKIAEWQVPIAWARTELRGEADGLMVVTIEGDSMTPTIGPGEKVIVNRALMTPSPGGIFALWDGLATVVKRIEYIPNSEPAHIRIISDNERYDSYERVADEIHIIGRVVCRLQRL